jgi:hypothetical protein
MSEPTELDKELFAKWQAQHEEKPYSEETLKVVAVEGVTPEAEREILNRDIKLVQDEIKTVQILIEQKAIQVIEAKNDAIRKKIMDDSAKLMRQKRAFNNLLKDLTQKLNDNLKY